MYYKCIIVVPTNFNRCFSVSLFFIQKTVRYIDISIFVVENSGGVIFSFFYEIWIKKTIVL